MGETFYSALGVATDADAETIRDAYREQVKERHPDVSDDPGAPREFKRLTTARDVLTDEDERARYDSLGHSSYVTRHLDTSAWTVEDVGSTGRGDGSRSGSGSGSGTDAGTAGRARYRRSDAGGYDRSSWLGEDWDGPRETHRGATGANASTGSRDSAENESWQHASAAYRYTPSSVPTKAPSAWRSLGDVLRTAGPWLLVHLVLLTSAVVLTWYIYATAGSVVPLSIPALAFGLLLVGLVLFMSILHLVTIVYS